MDKRKDSKKLQETKVKTGDQAGRVSDYRTVARHGQEEGQQEAAGDQGKRMETKVKIQYSTSS